MGALQKIRLGANSDSLTDKYKLLHAVGKKAGAEYVGDFSDKGECSVQELCRVPEGVFVTAAVWPPPEAFAGTPPHIGGACDGEETRTSDIKGYLDSNRSFASEQAVNLDLLPKQLTREISAQIVAFCPEHTPLNTTAHLANRWCNCAHVPLSVDVASARPAANILAMWCSRNQWNRGRRG
jgi:hypothetical protein